MGALERGSRLFQGPDTLTDEAIAELLAWEMEGRQGQPPDVGFNPDTDLMPALSIPTQSMGTVTWTPASLGEGTYAAFCFFPTAGEDLPHACHGMPRVLTVE